MAVTLKVKVKVPVSRVPLPDTVFVAVVEIGRSEKRTPIAGVVVALGPGVLSSPLRTVSGLPYAVEAFTGRIPAADSLVVSLVFDVGVEELARPYVGAADTISAPNS